jgi:hypothetical protein
MDDLDQDLKSCATPTGNLQPSSGTLTREISEVSTREMKHLNEIPLQMLQWTKTRTQNLDVLTSQVQGEKLYYVF